MSLDDLMQHLAEHGAEPREPVPWQAWLFFGVFFFGGFVLAAVILVLAGARLGPP